MFLSFQRTGSAELEWMHQPPWSPIFLVSLSHRRGSNTAFSDLNSVFHFQGFTRWTRERRGRLFTMERKSWPWRKKPDKTMPAANSATSNATVSMQSEDQVMPRPPLTGSAHALRAVNEEEVEENFKAISQRIQDLSTELVSKDEYLRQQTQIAKEAMEEIVSMRGKLTQHALIAEEAAAGREKIASDYSTLKQQLEKAYQLKNSAEARVLHLEAALKECNNELRNVREEQDQKLHETVLAKKREWDKIRAEIELQMAHFKRQVLESGAENSAMGKSLQERARSLVELNDAKAKAETEAKVLQVQIERMEKEMDAYKYEVHVLNKELQIRNEEKEQSKKAADAAHKQQLENVKKIAKLESECQRLRALIRKKLPGPGALAQMRMEVGYVSKLEAPKKRSNLRSLQNATELEDLRVGNAKEMDALTDRVIAMEDETKLLKEVLVKRTAELQAARQLCARTATKLSSAENLLEAIARGETQAKASCDSQVTSSTAAVETMDVMDWAASSEEGANDDEVSCAESWASALIAELSHLKNDEASPKTRKNSCEPNCKSDNVAEGLPHQVSQLQSTLNATLHKIIDKLSSVVDNLQSLECSLNSQCDKSPGLFELLQPGFSRLSDDISGLKQALQEVRNVMECAKLARANRESVDSSHSKASDSLADEGGELLLREQVVDQISSTQLTTLQKVLCNVVESLILLGVQEDRCCEAGDVVIDQKPLPLRIEAQGLVVLQNDRLVLDCEDQDAGAVLFQVVNVLRRQFGLDPVGDENLVTKLSNQITSVSCSEPVSSEVPEQASSQESTKGDLSDRIDQFNRELMINEMVKELENVRLELVTASDQKNELEQKLHTAEQELERTKGRLLELEEELARVEKELRGKQSLETELTSARTELEQMQAKVADLTTKLEEQSRRCEELQGMLAKRDGTREATAGRKSADGDSKSRKDCEVAAAKQQLAECQRTILVLGNQLRSLTTSHDPVEGSSFDSSIEFAASTDQKTLAASRADLVDSAAGNCFDESAAVPPPLVDGYHHSQNLLVPRRLRRPFNSGFVRTRNGRLISAEHFLSSNASFMPAGVEAEVYPANQVHCQTALNPAYSFNSRLPSTDLYAGGMCLQSPLHEYVTEASAYNYSPPETAMSSPARSPARFDAQLEHVARRRSTTNSATIPRSTPMNMITISTGKPSKSSSSSRLFRLFTRAKN